MPEPQSQPEPISVHIQRPACPRYRAQMMLARIMPQSVGLDLRTFECPKCDHVHQVMVETDAVGPTLKGARLGLDGDARLVNDANDRAPRGREPSVREGLTRINVDWSGSWQAARPGNWLGRSPATKAALGR